LPSELQGVTVSINGSPAYIDFYCSAATNPTACPSDQINVLTPLDTAQGRIRVVVSNNGVDSTPFVVTMRQVEPSFLLFDTLGHIVATHLDSTLVAPSTL